jgi:hypothetical protein
VQVAVVGGVLWLTANSSGVEQHLQDNSRNITSLSSSAVQAWLCAEVTEQQQKKHQAEQQQHRCASAEAQSMFPAPANTGAASFQDIKAAQLHANQYKHATSTCCFTDKHAADLADTCLQND